MTPFELALAQTIKVYDAGVKGSTVPYFPGMRVRDVERVYTEGRLDALAELDQAQERGDLIVAFDSYERFGSPKAIADFVTTKAAKFARRFNWPIPK